MTDIIEPADQSGEARLRRRRKSFWRYVALAVLVAFVVGIASGVGVALVEEEILPGWVIYIAIALIVIGFAWFTRDYYRRVDELDLLDNLWAALVAIYFYVCALPVWFVLQDAGLAPEPDHWIIWGGTMIVMLVTYGVRKLGWR